MGYVTQAQIAKAKEVGLLSYLQRYEPDEVVRFSGDTYTTKTHDSLKISNGMWYWWSKGIGGKSALDYLIKVRGFAFTDAVLHLTDAPQILSARSMSTKKKAEKQLLLPAKSANASIVKRYLMGRGIDQSIVEHCITKGIIFESLPSHNVIFLGLDLTGTPSYAGFRGTGKTRFLGEATGSDKHFSFRLVANQSATVHVFESAIDLLSYATILAMQNKPWRNQNLLSLAGVYQPAKIMEDSKVPIALQSFLNQNRAIKKVVFHLDRDDAGKRATQAITLALDSNYQVVDNPVPYGKDVNDYLCALKGFSSCPQAQHADHGDAR